MATTREKERPRSHVIEPAKSDRSTCQSCGGAIADGELRLSEAYVSDDGKWARAHRNARQPRYSELSGDDRRYDNYHTVNPDVWSRFHHLACAAEHQPYKLRSALGVATIEIPDRKELEAAIERALSAVDVAEENEATREEYGRFLDRLRETPDDELMLVFGDWLQSVGDPRGELVAAQHAAETATGEEKLRLADVEKKLLAVHRKHLTPDALSGSLLWRRGFIHRVVLGSVDPTTLARTFSHPSFRLLRELVVDIGGWTSVVVAANLPRPLPSTLRVIELRNKHGGLGAIGPLLADAVPQLERLKLDGAAELDDVRHGSLAELELVCADAREETLATPRGERRTLVDRASALSAKKLPNLTRLVLRVDRHLDDVIAALAGTKLLKKLSSLTLAGDLSNVDGLKGCKLEVLDVRGVRLGGGDLAKLGKHAQRLVVDEPSAAPPPAVPKQIGEWLVRHTRKPEWGMGRVVEEGDDGLQVEFEHGGKKHVRNVELLEEIESP